MHQKIIDAVERFDAVVKFLECECDPSCSIHADKTLVQEALLLIAGMDRE